MFYLLDKEKGITSFKFIRNFARNNNIKKIGHTGTLDPLATGLILVATDDDTKLIDYVDKGFKSYRATLEFGKISDTFDIEGNVKSKGEYEIPSLEQIESSLKNFEGTSLQTPPIFSAKKVNGQRAYNLARAGKEITLKKTSVKMKNFKIIDFKAPYLIFEVEVSRGTYIRSLISDLGNMLVCGAIMTDLRRITIGCLNESNLGKEIKAEDIINLPMMKLEDILDLKNGLTIPTKLEDGIYALKWHEDIVGIVIAAKKILKVKKLFGKKL